MVTHCTKREDSDLLTMCVWGLSFRLGGYETVGRNSVDPHTTVTNSPRLCIKVL